MVQVISFLQECHEYILCANRLLYRTPKLLDLSVPFVLKIELVRDIYLRETVWNVFINYKHLALRGFKKCIFLSESLNSDFIPYPA